MQEYFILIVVAAKLHIFTLILMQLVGSIQMYLLQSISVSTLIQNMQFRSNNNQDEILLHNLENIFKIQVFGYFKVVL
jgi:hypothetical protein